MRNARVVPAPMWDLVEESLDEAEFLWRQWEAALSTHDRDLAGVRFWIEERLLGSLDGVRAAGPGAYEALVLPALDAEDPFRATAAAYVLAVAGDHQGVEALVAAVRDAKIDRLPIFRRALELAPAHAVMGHVESALAKATSAEVAAMLLDVASFQQRDTLDHARWAAGDASPILQASGLRALRSSRPDLRLDLVERHLGSTDLSVRQAAIETALLAGSPAAWSCCREIAKRPEPGSDRLLLYLAMLGSDADLRALVGLLGDGGAKRGALFALGFAGTRTAAVACLEMTKDEALAKLAGEAFCAIVGIDMVKEGMVLADPEPPEEPVPFEEEDLDADLVPKPEDLLPRPDPKRLEDWWERHRRLLAESERYIGGVRADLAGLQTALERGPTRRRHAIAAELAVRSGGRYRVETRAFSADQQRQMATFARLGPEVFRVPLARRFSLL
jgi:uncharacterized protein (TIGR02270 family)